MILVIDDDIAIGASLRLLFRKKGKSCVTCTDPKQALHFIEKHQPEIILLDMNFTIETTGKEGLKLLGSIKNYYPAIPVILITGWGTIQLAIEGMKAGAVDFITKPWDNKHLWDSVETALHLALKSDNTGTPTDKDFDLVVSEDPKMLEILDMVHRVAPTEASVLITGESGTGKEILAEAIHHLSKRSERPFVKVNLGGISNSLFESEMFGHARGAFTDARSDRMGRFEAAETGSIFLDEIGELDLGSQVKLLRVLQDKTYEVLGSSKTRKTNVRVISATNRILPEMVIEGSFREDLYYRINLITIKIPPLRERPRDINLLAEYFISNLKKIYHREQLELTKDGFDWLQAHPFPGNVRELKNLIERTVLMSKTDLIDAKALQSFSSFTAHKDNKHPVGIMTLEEMEISMINRAMSHHQNNITHAAKSLGITRHALYRRIEKYNLQYDTSQ